MVTSLALAPNSITIRAVDMNVYSYGSALSILNIDWSVSAQYGG